MLLKNFRPLIEFGDWGTFKNVAGTVIDKSSFLVVNGRGNNGNGHSIKCATQNYNYNSTTAANNFVAEQTAYTYHGIVGTINSSSPTDADKYNGFILFLGTGNTPVTSTDYKLDTPCTLAVTSSSCLHYQEGYTLVERTFQNNTGSSVTIKEVGCYLFQEQGTRNTAYPILIGRKVLSVPVTIAANESCTFNYIINSADISLEGSD